MLLETLMNNDAPRSQPFLAARQHHTALFCKHYPLAYLLTKIRVFNFLILNDMNMLERLYHLVCILTPANEGSLRLGIRVFCVSPEKQLFLKLPKAGFEPLPFRQED